MKVYALIFEVGISSGHRELIRIFDNATKAELSLKAHIKKYGYRAYHYSIKEIEINKEINYTIADW